jgi:hypothetical protein
MPSEFGTWSGALGLNSVIVPYVAGIPAQLRQGDSAIWNDRSFVDQNGTTYDSTGYTLKYVLAGPIHTPVTLTAAASGPGWQTTLSTTTSATLAPGTYSWQAQVAAAGVRLTIDQGESLVLADLASVGANYDGRTSAEIALEQAKQAFATFTQSGGRVRSYTIGHRSMTFDNLSDIKIQVDFWKKEVAAERLIARGGQSRTLHLRFDRTR